MISHASFIKAHYHCNEPKLGRTIQDHCTTILHLCAKAFWPFSLCARLPSSFFERLVHFPKCSIRPEPHRTRKVGAPKHHAWYIHLSGDKSNLRLPSKNSVFCLAPSSQRAILAMSRVSEGSACMAQKVAPQCDSFPFQTSC